MITARSGGLDRGGLDGGVAARRAVIRWAMRLVRREWRQQILVLSLLTAAVAVATATPGHPAEATFGSATAMVSLPGDSPRLSADIAEIRADYGAVNVIEDQDLATGATQTVTLRAEDPNASFGSPRLALISGRYPDAPGQVALTSSVASLYGVKTGGVARLAGRSWTVTGIVENPANLLDEFALVQPGQVTAPTRVTVLFDAPHGSVTGLPVSYPIIHNDGVSPAVIALAASVLGLVFIGLVAVAGLGGWLLAGRQPPVISRQPLE